VTFELAASPDRHDGSASEIGDPGRSAMRDGGPPRRNRHSSAGKLVRRRVALADGGAVVGVAAPDSQSVGYVVLECATEPGAAIR
jgi:hypothetical protein